MLCSGYGKQVRRNAMRLLRDTGSSSVHPPIHRKHFYSLPLCTSPWFFLLCVHVCRLCSLHEQIRFVDQAVRNDIIEMIERRIRKHPTTGLLMVGFRFTFTEKFSFQLSRTCLARDRTRNKGKTQIVSVGNSACNQSSAESNPECTVQLYFGSIQCVFCFSLLLPLFCLP